MERILRLAPFITSSVGRRWRSLAIEAARICTYLRPPTLETRWAVSWTAKMALAVRIKLRKEHDEQSFKMIQSICQDLPNLMTFEDIQQLTLLPHSLRIRTS